MQRHSGQVPDEVTGEQQRRPSAGQAEEEAEVAAVAESEKHATWPVTCSVTRA